MNRKIKNRLLFLIFIQITKQVSKGRLAAPKRLSKSLLRHSMLY